MDKNNLIELTNKVYKLTLLFPKKEPLRYKIREVADDILACNSSSKKLQENLGVLKKYFEVAKWQNWVSYFDVLSLEEEYDEIRDQIHSSDLEEKDEIIPLPESVPSIIVDNSLDTRKERILGLLKEKGRVQVWEVSKVFPEVSKRTLRRDFVQLLELGLIERIGERNDTFYKLKTQEI